MSIFTILTIKYRNQKPEVRALKQSFATLEQARKHCEFLYDRNCKTVEWHLVNDDGVYSATFEHYEDGWYQTVECAITPTELPGV